MATMRVSLHMGWICYLWPIGHILCRIPVTAFQHLHDLWGYQSCLAWRIDKISWPLLQVFKVRGNTLYALSSNVWWKTVASEKNIIFCFSHCAACMTTGTDTITFLIMLVSGVHAIFIFTSNWDNIPVMSLTPNMTSVCWISFLCIVWERTCFCRT